MLYIECGNVCVCTKEQDKTLENFHIDFEGNGRAANVWVVYVLPSDAHAAQPYAVHHCCACAEDSKGCGITS